MKVPYSEPGTTKKNKNNSSPNVPTIDIQKCIGCRQCIENCPDVCITLDSNKKAVVDYDHCKGCGICSEICPVKAISMKSRVIK